MKVRIAKFITLTIVDLNWFFVVVGIPRCAIAVNINFQINFHLLLAFGNNAECILKFINMISLINLFMNAAV